MKGREVKAYDKATNELVGVFDSATNAAYEFDIDYQTVKRSIQGKDIKGDVYFISEDESPFTNRKTKVYWYDNKTNELLGVFDSALEASQKTGIPASTIRNNLYGRTKTAAKKQYYFRSPIVEFKPEHPEPYIQKGKSKDWLKKGVDVYDVETDELLKECDSVTEAANFIGVDSGRIVSHLKYKPKYKHQPTIHKKYYCKYHNE